MWLLHMDDDTGIGMDTARELAAFISRQEEVGAQPLHLAQGILCFPREHARNRLVWLADAVRPACDIALFAATTGSGSPRAGLHGESLLVRASVEDSIVGTSGCERSTRTRNSRFASPSATLDVAAGIPGRSYGASPATVSDYVRQRERWIWGLLELVVSRSIQLRYRLLIIDNIAVWSCASIAHPVIVVLIEVLIGDGHTTPVSGVVIPFGRSTRPLAPGSTGKA